MLQGLNSAELLAKFLESSEILLEEATEGLLVEARTGLGLGEDLARDRSRSYPSSQSQSQSQPGAESEGNPETLTQKLTTAIRILQTTILDAHFIFFRGFTEDEFSSILRYHKNQDAYFEGHIVL